MKKLLNKIFGIEKEFLVNVECYGRECSTTGLKINRLIKAENENDALSIFYDFYINEKSLNDYYIDEVACLDTNLIKHNGMGIKIVSYNVLTESECRQIFIDNKINEILK